MYSNDRVVLNYLCDCTTGFVNGNVILEDNCVPGPTFTFGFILATLFGAVFHLIVGGDVRRLALFLLAGWLGFSLGQALGTMLGINIVSIGQMRVVAASLGSIVALIAANVLTSRRTNNRTFR